MGSFFMGCIMYNIFTKGCFVSSATYYMAEMCRDPSEGVAWTGTQKTCGIASYICILIMNIYFDIIFTRD